MAGREGRGLSPVTEHILISQGTRCQPHSHVPRPGAPGRTVPLGPLTSTRSLMFWPNTNLLLAVSALLVELSKLKRRCAVGVRQPAGRGRRVCAGAGRTRASMEGVGENARRVPRSAFPVGDVPVAQGSSLQAGLCRTVNTPPTSRKEQARPWQQPPS